MKKLSLMVLLVLIAMSCSTKLTESPLKKSMPLNFQNKVFVLGSMHLAGHKEFSPKLLDGLVGKLSSWEPTQICVETRNPEEIYKMTQLAPYNLGVKKILKMFDLYKVNLSKRENKKFKYSFFKAYSLLSKELSAKTKNHEKIIQLALISYDYFNALLYWSRLSPEARKRLKISKKSKESLNKSLKQNNEINTLAIRLANKNSLEKLCAVDSQISAAGVLKADEKEVEELFSSPSRAKWRERASFKEFEEVQKQGFKNGDLLPVYAYMNKASVSYDDETQWEWLYEDRTKKGLNRVRFAAWDVRNAQIAKNILRIGQSRKKEKILFIVGMSHKSIIERFLKASNFFSVESIDLD